jgi:hypothetical protein
MCVHISINIVYIYNIMVIIVDSMIRSRSRWQDTSLSRALSEYSWCKSRPWDASATRALVDTSLLWFARVHFSSFAYDKSRHTMSCHDMSCLFLPRFFYTSGWLLVNTAGVDEQNCRWVWLEENPSGVCDFPQCLGGATVDGDISKDLEEIVG